MIGRSGVKMVSNSLSGRPCGCSVSGWSRIRSTTLTTRTFSSGRCWRSRSAAASVSRVGTSPQQASTTSGSLPSSLLAQSQMPRPRRVCWIASVIVSQFGDGCLPATTTLM